ncbi:MULTISPECIES: substrate-binding domain-containing protein [unclassified Undibacterium]|uniref:substrate-binding domain-containing protein n=1 Tax=unclassified Undibacterium TaxID=2630295 RepID=UPI002AC98FC0|nr:MULTISPECIES: substrate-binding domain-containing protein [unclassified Undibacterium]MEB0138918.1 substrate-binding domain-containing protein [Undibacterium sp. CCC2.1]MEB0171751.1 substrate-binding domain-containing protein [Undibacterium sp. CCC1.1]MEB0175549.1 substrate-binding domain-containing protein [Undibacterium sp. CCC3.4]MEB0214953.1 substrate-binding domain-containing protein [Undibacterium sp. 5I2]WPX44935.1 substrate-binding domain-containing protein [Undibacterium sp. CCC3.4
MNATPSKCLTLLFLAFNLIASAFAQENPMQFMSRANAKVARAESLKNRWEGPVAGPKLQKKKKIIFIAADMSDAAIGALFNGVKEAGIAGAWETLSIDCRGRCNQGAAIISQALDMKADGIILAGIDVSTQAKGLAAADKAKVPVVGWHASIKSGPVGGLFTNITSNPKEVAQVAALYMVVEADSKAGIVLFTDSSNPYLQAKSATILETIKQCESCRLLSVEDVPLADGYVKMKTAVEAAVKRHGAKWTHVIAVNDFYFDLLTTASIAPLVAANKLIGVSAGDGSPSAYQRIRSNGMQSGTVPEPLVMHAWQLVDELNRAFCGQAASSYVTPVHLVTVQNIAYDGGNKNAFDPANDYRLHYQQSWLK